MILNIQTEIIPTKWGSEMSHNDACFALGESEEWECDVCSEMHQETAHRG